MQKVDYTVIWYDTTWYDLTCYVNVMLETDYLKFNIV